MLLLTSGATMGMSRLHVAGLLVTSVSRATRMRMTSSMNQRGRSSKTRCFPIHLDKPETCNSPIIYWFCCCKRCQCLRIAAGTDIEINREGFAGKKKFGVNCGRVESS